MTGASPRVRIGVAVLDSDRVLEDDLRLLLPPDVGTYVARVPYPGTVSDDALERAELELAAAVGRLLPVRPHAVVWACTSSSFRGGLEGLASLRSRLGAWASGAAAWTATDAVLDDLAHLGARRVAVGTPYSAPITAALVEVLEDMGYDVVEARRLPDTDDDWDLQDREPDELAEFSIDLARTGADTVLLACTGLRTATLPARVAEATGRSFTSSNVAIAASIRRFAAERSSIAAAGRARVGEFDRG